MNAILKLYLPKKTEAITMSVWVYKSFSLPKLVPNMATLCYPFLGLLQTNYNS